MTPSAEAMELAIHLSRMVTPKDASGYWKLVRDNEQYLASELDTALAQASMKGALAMREVAARIAETHAVDQTRGYTKVVDVPPEGSNFEKQGRAIRALDPQQVINESIGK